MQILVMTSAKYHHLLPGFCYMFNGYWGEPAIIATDTAITHDLPDNFTIYSYSDWKPLPASRWGNGLRHALKSVGEGLVTILFEDYYLIAPVNEEVIKQGLELFQEYPDHLLRFDLTTDRMYNGHAKDLGRYGIVDLVETPFDSEYQMSFQAGIWNKNLLLSLVSGGLSPWQTEMYIQPPQEMRVFGTKNEPVRYANIVRSGGYKHSINYDEIPDDHMQVMRERGWLHE